MAVRGAAALMIVLFHFTWAYNDKSVNSGVYATDWPWSVWWGYAAVATFFMMSGYLATPHIIDRQPDPRKFIFKKLKRFYPAYWVSMTVTAIVLYLFFKEESVSLSGYLVNLTMVSQLFRVPFVDGVYWSMQCELLFCLIAASLMFLGGGRKLDRALIVWIALAIALSFTTGIKPLRVFRIVTIGAYCHNFIAGIVICRFSMSGRNRLSPAEMLTLVLCLTNSIVWSGAFTPPTVFFALTAAVLLTLDRLDKIICNDNVIVKALGWIAMISYPLYLTHEMIGFTIIRHMQLAGWRHHLFIIVPITVTFAIGWAIHHFVEKRIK